MDDNALNGEKIAEAILMGLKKEIDNFQQEFNSDLKLGLAFVVVGENEKARRNRTRIGKAIKSVDLPIRLRSVELDESTTEADLLAEIRKLNEDPEVHAILIAQPFNSNHSINVRTAIEEVDCKKDIEGLKYRNYERLEYGQECILPPVAAASLEMIKATDISLPGKHVVVITSQTDELVMIYGNPTVQLLRRHGCAVTYLDPNMENAADVSKRADVVVAMGAGSKRINSSWIKPDENTVVIDAGFYISKDGHLSGDVDTDEVRKITRWVSPVPRGIGPVIGAKLLVNSVHCAIRLVIN